FGGRQAGLYLSPASARRRDPAAAGGSGLTEVDSTQAGDLGFEAAIRLLSEKEKAEPEGPAREEILSRPRSAELIHGVVLAASLECVLAGEELLVIVADVGTGHILV